MRVKSERKKERGRRKVEGNREREKKERKRKSEIEREREKGIARCTEKREKRWE